MVVNHLARTPCALCKGQDHTRTHTNTPTPPHARRQTPGTSSHLLPSPAPREIFTAGVFSLSLRLALGKLHDSSRPVILLQIQGDRREAARPQGRWKAESASFTTPPCSALKADHKHLSCPGTEEGKYVSPGIPGRRRWAQLQSAIHKALKPKRITPF